MKVPIFISFKVWDLEKSFNNKELCYNIGEKLVPDGDEYLQNVVEYW
ncbi:hypothetical protein KAJ27_02400 [bacterium]|nr:hypothetical protein [bacterium]